MATTMSNAEYAVFVAALRLQLSAAWVKDGPCECWEGEVPSVGYYVSTPRGKAVHFRVLGREFCELGCELRAREIADLLRSRIGEGEAAWAERS